MSIYGFPPRNHSVTNWRLEDEIKLMLQAHLWLWSGCVGTKLTAAGTGFIHLLRTGMIKIPQNLITELGSDWEKF
jgi:hypothetical protein